MISLGAPPKIGSQLQLTEPTCTGRWNVSEPVACDEAVFSPGKYESYAPQGPPLFKTGFGGNYVEPSLLPIPNTECALLSPDLSQGLAIFGRGLSPAVTAKATDAERSAVIANLVGSSPSGNIVLRAFDITAQEDGRRLIWKGAGQVDFDWSNRDLPGDGEIVLRYRATTVPRDRVTLLPHCQGCSPEGVDLTPSLRLGADKGWRNLRLPLACISDGPISGFAIASSGAFALEIDSLNIALQAADDDCTGQF